MPRDEETNLYAVGDVIARGGAFLSCGKVIAIQTDPADKYHVNYTVVMKKGPPKQWSGSRYYFTDPICAAEWNEMKAKYLLERAQRIRDRVAEIGKR